RNIFRELIGFYELGDDILAKSCSKYEAEKEKYYGDLLGANGINVPGNYDIISFRMIKSKMKEFGISRNDCGFTQECMVNSWFSIMEKVDAVDFRDIPKEELELPFRLFKDEIRKVLDLGVYPNDCNWAGNALYDGKEKKVYLIDFSDWNKDFFSNGIKEFCEALEHGEFNFRWN
ncbi:MAG: hypothetical protein KKA79_10815, partial [Nanoarchaeota archaeon]|nr:hypothetical protein [Nanoarchaeota archaeon]